MHGQLKLAFDVHPLGGAAIPKVPRQVRGSRVVLGRAKVVRVAHVYSQVEITEGKTPKGTG
eukprot:11225426-Lingulodinium_polyedra.AAC.1